MASSRIPLLCLLGLLLVASPAIADDSSGIYYQLALLWPGAYCEQTNAGCCKPTTGVSPARDFYITGLTVYNATTNAALTECSNQAPYNPNLITGIGLEQYWINIKCPANNGQRSWKNAWKKAGACSGLDEKAYFEKALSFRSKINPLVRLKQNGIEDDFELYGLKAIKKVFKSGINAEPVIQCSKGPFDKYMLYQLYFCANGNGTFIDCPAPAKYTCSNSVLFHPYKKWMLKQQLSDESADFYDSADPFVLPGLAMDN
ncbi:hypothetical protein BDA96_02G293200 [Sorghum bicolor]|uniref:Uncharacterized protein n=2 Tax=Sorghum bicolor TaxID=4558 RepID=A0A921RR45_SORBI|nr:extracellular ribonuclease LE [Sorghum bicolor]EER99263.1 hypothetical protein SORBI_3002G278800 [Sorghum bicolor]KAG0544637.1 hypothetical protein BDA96_02G293200 [Sorghum bicolor]|eukprot:XP_002462742.1 extracellular ribonuclease LE [Sorghum bicolor]